MSQSQLATRSSASCWASGLVSHGLLVLPRVIYLGSSVRGINCRMVRLVIICEICAGAKLEGGTKETSCTALALHALTFL